MHAEVFNGAAPWALPVARSLGAVEAAWRAGMPLPEALNRQAVALRPGSAGVRFVPQSELPAGTAYEQFIFDTRTVPTRENLHDFFNGLCWLRYPLTKERLNHLQAAQIATDGVRDVRGPVRDALTLFDENAALLQAPQPLWDALIERDWTALFVTLRPLWSEASLVLFGHALLEKLVMPYKSITAHVFREPVPAELGDDLAAWDDWLAQTLNAPLLSSKPFTPLPVLGVPGWWPANDDPAYYADAQVFRPRRIENSTAS